MEIAVSQSNIVVAPTHFAILQSKCGGELYKRPDDNKETIFKRMQVYENETAPLKGFYEREGNLKTMPGQGTVDEVFSRVCALVS